MQHKNNIVQFGDVAIKILSNSESLTVAEIAFPAGVAAAVHQHPHEEVNYVARGTFDFMCDGKVSTLTVGESIRIPPGLSHNITCHDEDGIVLSSWTPSRQDLIAKLG